MADLQIPGDFGLQSPAIDTVEVTLSDTEDLPQAVKAMWINTDGTITGIALFDQTPRTYNVFAGTALPVVFRRIFATGTTAEFVAFVK